MYRGKLLVGDSLESFGMKEGGEEIRLCCFPAFFFFLTLKSAHPYTSFCMSLFFKKDSLLLVPVRKPKPPIPDVASIPTKAQILEHTRGGKELPKQIQPPALTVSNLRTQIQVRIDSFFFLLFSLFLFFLFACILTET
jgi:hypothetical protein